MAVNKGCSGTKPPVPKANVGQSEEFNSWREITIMNENKAKAKTKPISVIADTPSINPKLGFSEFAEALANAIRGCEPPQFTIGIYGAWGSGKSSLLNAIENQLLTSDSEVIPVLFDAWRYEKSDYIIIPLLHKIYETVQEVGDTKISSNLGRVLKSLIFSLKFNLGVVSIDSSSIRRFWEDEGLSSLDQAFSKPFKELKRIPDALEGRRIAVLIDDLDRCSPENVISILESINLVMDVPGFIFVLALDYNSLISAIETEYPHVSGEVFVQKIIQLPFRVPPLDVMRHDFTSELIPEWTRICKSETIPEEKFGEIIRNIALHGLNTNPRQIKRLVNSYLLIDHIIGNRENLHIDRPLLIALIGVQLRWPSHYQSFQNEVLNMSRNPFKVFTDADDEPDLVKYSERFFTKVFSNAVLREIIQLASFIEPPKPGEEGEDIPETIDEGRKRLVGILRKNSFSTKRVDHIYYGEIKPDVRFVMQTQVIRYEVRRAGDWKRKFSYHMKREFKDAEWAIIQSQHI